MGDQKQNIRDVTLIVVHGVGDSPPGASVLEFCEGIHEVGVWGQRSDLIIDGVEYPRVLLQHPRLSQVIEVNWSDIARPSKWDLFSYVVRVVMALFAVGRSTPAGKPWPIKAYERCFEAVLVYCIYPAVATMFALSVPGIVGLIVALITSAAVGFLTLKLTRYGTALRMGWLWAFATGVIVAGLHGHILSARSAVQITSLVYVGGQIVTSLLLSISLLCLASTRDERQLKIKPATIRIPVG